jgi:hypothetical protein
MWQLSMSRRLDGASAIPDRERQSKLGHAFLKVAVAPRPPSLIRLPQNTGAGGIGSNPKQTYACLHRKLLQTAHDDSVEE